MLRNQKKSYPLILFVILIWGILFFKFFKIINKNNKFIKTEKSNNTIINKIQADTFTLKINYRDPFKYYKKQKEKNNKIISRRRKKTILNKNKPADITVKKKVHNINIKYGGNIYSKDLDQTVALLSVFGKNIILEEGGTAGKLELLKIYDDSVYIKFEDENYTIKK